MDKMFKEYGEKWKAATKKADLDAEIKKQVRELDQKIQRQANTIVSITEEDPGLEMADAGLRPTDQHTDQDRRLRLERVRQAEKNLAIMRSATESPEKEKAKGAYGKRRRKRRRKRKFGKKKKKAKKVTLKKVVKRVGKEAKKIVKGVKKVGGKMTKGVKKVGGKMTKEVKKITKNIKEIFDKNSFGRSYTLPPTFSEGSYTVQGYDPRAIVMQSLFGKRKRKKFGGCKSCGHKFGKRRRSGYKFGTKCVSQCAECGSSISGFDPMAIVQKKLSYGKRRRKRKFGEDCHCTGHGHDKKFGKRRRRKKSSFGKKAKKPSAALKKLCKKHKVRLTVKRGKKRVYKSEKMLKKQCKMAMKRKKKKTVKRKSRCGNAFGKKAKKPSAALRRLCKKHKVRLTVKRGKKRVYKSEKVLKKQCKKAIKRKK
jgi:hypothetical protein